MSSPKFVTSSVASSVPFDNSTNGFVAENTQAAIEEVQAGVTTPSIPEYTTDPISPAAENVWVLRTTAGTPVGLLLALTLGIDIYQLSYKTIEGPIVRTTLR